MVAQTSAVSRRALAHRSMPRPRCAPEPPIRVRGHVDGLQYSSTTLPIDGLMSWERCKVEHHVQKALHGRKLSRAPTSIRRGPNVTELHPLDSRAEPRVDSRKACSNKRKRPRKLPTAPVQAPAGTHLTPQTWRPHVLTLRAHSTSTHPTYDRFLQLYVHRAHRTLQLYWSSLAPHACLTPAARTARA